MTKACVPTMSECRSGRIVDVTSSVMQGVLNVCSHYIAAVLGSRGITVNSVAPGVCETTLIGDISIKAQFMITHQTPLWHLAKSADVAAVVEYLAPDDVAVIAGDTIALNGGMAML